MIEDEEKVVGPIDWSILIHFHFSFDIFAAIWVENVNGRTKETFIIHKNLCRTKSECW